MDQDYTDAQQIQTIVEAAQAEDRSLTGAEMGAVLALAIAIKMRHSHPTGGGN